MAFRLAGLALALSAMTACDSSSRQPAVTINLDQDVGQAAIANEQHAEDQLEAGIRANMADRVANEAADEAADAAFLSNLDDERNASVAARVEAMQNEDAAQAKREQMDATIRRDLGTSNVSED